MKSLRRIGMSTLARTASRSASEPPKRRCSVRTEMTDAAGLVVRGECGRVGDRGQGPLGGAGALDLADDGHALAAQGGDSVLGLGSARRAFLELVEADTRLPLREVGANAIDDLVEHTHASGPFRNGDEGTGSAFSMVSAGGRRARIR